MSTDPAAAPLGVRPLVAQEPGAAGATPPARIVFALVVFAAALVGFSTLLRSVLPAPPDPLGVKLDYFRAHKDEFDVVFVGSSFTYRQILPSRFDARAGAELGPLRSFNLGVPGLAGLPMLYVVKQVLELEPERLRWVVVEPNVIYWTLLLEEENVRSNQVVRWHDATTTWLALRLLARSQLPRGPRLTLARRHLLSFAYSATALGRAADLVRETLSDAEAGPDAEAVLGPLSDGHRSLETAVADPATPERAMLLKRSRNQRSLAEAGWQHHVARNFTMYDPDLPPPVDEEEQLRAMVTGVLAFGATPIIVIPPSVFMQAGTVRAHQAGIMPHLLAYNRPRKFPEFYERKNWFDLTHLNDAGSALFTDRLADDFVRIAREQP